ncbi:MAG: undecaprenyl-phosphate glucose phosphotransferase [Bacteroidetes bacterium]|jgi:putative colanic acid biosynthesis UDP-glucose lipid carrier transferase|nr:undecaprenyl-phosphate glucose phosphotransferase [Bacteroidota bacterium]MBK7137835.1 undecaprenyl-phosphate glucose phosphotransferase [Bacteroidota bacterium]MBK9354837.1 undecaprenyl-phosphate glucose phosphotransferase [Bacteroidota bacterium]
MKRKVTHIYVLIQSFGDIIILNFSYILAHFLAFTNFTSFFDNKYTQLWAYLNAIYFISAQFSGTFGIYRVTRFSAILKSLFQLFFFQIVLAFSYIVVFKDISNTFKISREVLLILYSISSILMLIWRFGFIKILRFYRSKGFNTRKVIIVGAGATGQEFRKMLSNKLEYGYNFLGFFDDEPERFPALKDLIIGNVEEAKQFSINNNVDEIFCALPYKQEEKVRDLVEFGDNNLIRLKIVPDFSRFLTHQLFRVDIDHYGIFPVLTIRSEPLENYINRIVKRSFDFCFSALVFSLILWWLIPLIALIVKLSSKGPVFFIQDRSGLKNQVFRVYKFRTMYMNDEANEKQAQKGDARITPIGSILRKTNLDEIPQFLNVFLGHMSVIGPRPHMLKHTEEYAQTIDKFMVRHFVKPGITGWAQVNGFRGEIKDHQDLENRVLADVWYIENWSLLLDLRIILLTVFNMIKGEEKAY